MEQLVNSYRRLSPLARKTFKLLLIMTVVLVAIDIYVYAATTVSDAAWLRIVQGYVNTDIERSIPTWFNGGLWFVSAALALAIAAARSSKAWVGFGVICAALSLDEIIALHEGLGDQARKIVGQQSGLLNFEWVIIGAVLAIGLALAGYQAVKTLEKSHQRLIFIAGAVFVSGALGFESFSGLAIETSGTGLFYHSMAWVEETLEIAGVSLLVATLVSASGLVQAEV